MKKTMMFALAATLALMSVGCTSETAYGDCVGLDDNKNPELVYEVDTGNIVVGALLVETLVAPVYIALEEVYCPIGKTEKPAAVTASAGEGEGEGEGESKPTVVAGPVTVVSQ